MIWIFIVSLLTSVVSVAETAPDTAFARLDTHAILIGQQAKLQLTFQGTTKGRVLFPAVPDTFSMLEVVNRSGVDTISKTADAFTLSQTLMVTGFDSGYHVILPFEFLYLASDKKDTVKLSTKPLLLQVQSIPVDTTQSIKDIKDIEQVPFSIFDHLGWFLLGIFGILLFIIWKKYSSRFTKPKNLTPTTPPISCDEKALLALSNLEQKHLWQQGQYKAYHTELTDILREFITERWNVGAMEMTTDEIMSLSLFSTDSIEGIGYVLRMADMVKFAKGIPVGDENTRSLDIVRKFVISNKPISSINLDSKNA